MAERDLATHDHARNLSKVTPPTPHRVHLNQRLFCRLDAASERPIVWIHAPPGAGKTTLTASYLADKKIEPLWYRLDEGDADPATLFLYLSAAWKGGKSGLSLPILTPDKRAGLPMFARQFFRTLFSCPKTSVLVFDDYHEVAPDSALHQCVASGIEEVPRGCRVMIVSRTPPPPAFAKLRMNGLIEMIEPDALRLTLDEANGVARERQADIATSRVEAILQQTQGWTAGLILMLDAGADARAPRIDGTETSEVLFDYFAGEILDRMPTDRQMVLCILALMPTMTAAAANRLADTTDAEILLEELRRRNYFTVRDVAAVPRYRFHPLFRQFLLARGRTRLTADELNRLKVLAAFVLDETGQPEDAVGLLEETDSFDGIADIIVRRAEGLMEEGRFGTLTTWLAKLPASTIEANPWLVYWSGTASVYLQPSQSLVKLTTAFDLFRKTGDVIGQFKAWARQAEAVRVDAFGDNRRFDTLYDTMQDLLSRHPDIPKGRIMLSVALGMAMGLSRRTNKRDEIALWQDRARAAAREAPHDFLSGLVEYWFAIANFQDAKFKQVRTALDALPDPLSQTHPNLLVDVSGYIAYAMALLYRQKDGDCGAFCEEVIRRMESGGSLLWTHNLAAIAANEAYKRGDLPACGYWLRRTAECADRVTTGRGAHYHFAAAQYHLLLGEFETALGFAETGFAISQSSGWLYYEVITCLTRAEIFLEMGNFGECEAELSRADEIQARSATRGLAFAAGLLRADLKLARGETQSGLAHLADAFALARRQGDKSAGMLIARFQRLCARALKANIEPDHVRLIIRASRIPAPEDDENWPWPLKIRTLGGLIVTHYGEPLSFGRKTPKRLVMLLKAIIAYGGRDVPEEKLTDAIWPDDDGDAAHSALTIAIHRLRKLLGDAGLVIVKDGKVSLDPTRCWLDLWAFEQKLLPRKAAETQALYAVRRNEGLALYRGDFLPDNEDLWWTAERREALRKRRQRALAAA